MIELLIKRKIPHYVPPAGHYYITITKSLPFYKSAQGSYVHRIRSGKHHIWPDGYSHTSFELWCGMTGFSSKKHPSRLFEDPPTDGPICATCEGRAIGAGQTESRMICGRLVKFSPRL